MPVHLLVFAESVSRTKPQSLGVQGQLVEDEEVTPGLEDVALGGLLS